MYGSSFSMGVFVFVRVIVFEGGLRFCTGHRFRWGSSFLYGSSFSKGVFVFVRGIVFDGGLRFCTGHRFRRGSSFLYGASFSMGVFIFVRVIVFNGGLRFRMGLRFQWGLCFCTGLCFHLGLQSLFSKLPFGNPPLLGIFSDPPSSRFGFFLKPTQHNVQLQKISIPPQWKDF